MPKTPRYYSFPHASPLEITKLPANYLNQRAPFPLLAITIMHFALRLRHPPLHCSIVANQLGLLEHSTAASPAIMNAPRNRPRALNRRWRLQAPVRSPTVACACLQLLLALF